MRAATLDQRIAGVSYGWEGERNGSPSVQRVNGTVVRRNLAVDPLATRQGNLWGTAPGFSSRWAGNGGTSVITAVQDADDGPLKEIRSYLRKTWTVVGIALQDIAFTHCAAGLNGFPVVPGEIYSVSSFVRTSWPETGTAAYQRRISYTFTDSSGVSTSNVLAEQSPRQDALENAWNRLQAIIVVPEGAAFMTVAQYIFSTHSGTQNLGAGITLDSTGLLLERTTSVGDFFTGDSVVTSETINGVTPPRCSEFGSHLGCARLDPSQWRWAA